MNHVLKQAICKGMKRMYMTGAQLLVQALVDQGVEVVFGYPGGSILYVYDAMYGRENEIRHVLTSHEQGAAHAADGYARSTGRIGVVLATSGPGATNLVTGIATAYQDSVPMIAITCNVERDMIGRDGFQEIDIVDITNPIVKHNYLVQDVTEIEEIVQEAFVIAGSGRKGPVLIDIPKDITLEKAEYQDLPRYQIRKPPLPLTESIVRAVHVLDHAKQPVIYCGGGVTFSGGSQALVRFAERLQAPVCMSMMGLTSLPADHALYLGLVGMHGTAAANKAMIAADVIIAVGTRFSERVTGDRARFSEGKMIIHIDIDQSEISKNIPSDISLIAEAGACMELLSSRIRPHQNLEWLQLIETCKHKYRLPKPKQEDGAVSARKIISTLSDLVGRDAIIVTDVGQHQMFTAQYYKFYQPRTFLSSCGLGTMGYGMGAANGAAIGNPNRQVVLITGDGSFHMNLNELAVAVSNQLNILILVMNNNVLGMVHQWQKLFCKARYSHTITNRKTDYVKLAQAFGAAGMRIDDPDSAGETIQAALINGGPVVVDCPIDFHERVFPIIPPGKTGHDMIYTDKKGERGEAG